MPKLRILHFSDPHAGGGAEDCLAYFDKRWVGVFNYTFRRRFKFDLKYLGHFVAYALQNPPDLLICTGDLTSTGQPGEFARAMRLLHPLIRSKIPMIYVPGNHDYYVFRERCNNALFKVFKRLNSAFNLRFENLPARINFKGIELLVVNESGPSNLISSCGYLRKSSSDFIRQTVAESTAPFRILIGHYPVIEKHPILRIRHRMFGQKHILPLLYLGKIHLSLNGHVHAPYLRLNSKYCGEVCAGSITRNHCFNEITYDTETHCHTVQHFTVDPQLDVRPLDVKKESL